MRSAATLQARRAPRVQRARRNADEKMLYLLCSMLDYIALDERSNGDPTKRPKAGKGTLRHGKTVTYKGEK